MPHEDERRAERLQGNAEEHPADEARPRASEVDRMALDGTKSDWMSSTDAPAGAPPNAEELRGIDLLGRHDVRDGAIEGAAGGSGLDATDGAVVDAQRRNPPQVDAVDGGESGTTGGRAGGARGGFGRSDDGAGDPERETAGGPAEYRAASRFDLDHPSSTVGDDVRDAESGAGTAPDELDGRNDSGYSPGRGHR